MQLFRSTKRRNQALLGLSGLVIVCAIAVHLVAQRWGLSVLHPDRLVTILGPYGPAGVILGQAAQVLLMPIPPATAVVAGILYGPWLGTLYSFIGVTIGNTTAILLARRYGRPFVEFLLSDAAMDRFDAYTDKTGYIPFIVIFLLPGFPDDILCFIAGLTNLDWKRLAFIGSVGRLPGIILLTTTGYSLGEARPVLFIVTLALTGLLSFWSVRNTDRVERILHRIHSLVR